MVHEKLYKDLETHESGLEQTTEAAKGVDELPEAVPCPSSNQTEVTAPKLILI